MQRLAALSFFLFCGLPPITSHAADEPKNKVFVTGTVVDEAGNLVAGATVSRMSNNDDEPLITALDGRFQPLSSKIGSTPLFSSKVTTS